MKIQGIPHPRRSGPAEAAASRGRSSVPELVAWAASPPSCWGGRSVGGGRGRPAVGGASVVDAEPSRADAAPSGYGGGRREHGVRWQGADSGMARVTSTSR